MFKKVDCLLGNSMSNWRYLNNATNHPINLSYYAAGLCKQTISGYSDWYLPAICEMGYGATACGSSGAPMLQNMQTSLIDISNLSAPAGYYWSSTENSDSPLYYAWVEGFASGGDSDQFNSDKKDKLCVRCSRALTFWSFFPFILRSRQWPWKKPAKKVN